MGYRQNSISKSKKKEFKNKKIIIKKNYYLDSFKKINFIDKKIKNSILYICDPKRKINVNYTEKRALKYFFDNLYKICGEVSLITIRPHPSEEKKIF